MSRARMITVQDEQGRWRYLLSWQRRETAERWARAKASEGDAVEVAVVVLADGSYTVTWWAWSKLAKPYRLRGTLRDVLARNWEPLRQHGEITKAYKHHMGKRYYIAMRRGTGRADDDHYHVWTQGVDEGPLPNIEAVELWLLLECLCPLDHWYPTPYEENGPPRPKYAGRVAASH